MLGKVSRDLFIKSFHVHSELWSQNAKHKEDHIFRKSLHSKTVESTVCNAGL